jgi:hypothetical protein
MLAEGAQAKRIETSELSSPRTARKLEYTPREEPVIKTSTKKHFYQPLAFGYTEARTRSKVILPQ